MIEAFGLDRRLYKYKGKRPIGLYNCDFECILAVIEEALSDPTEYPDKEDKALKTLASVGTDLGHSVFPRSFS
jgi:hypothetical protein